MTATGRCLRPACGRAIYSRGLCRSCYLTALRLVQAQRTTWDALVAAGKAKDTTMPGRRSSRVDWFLEGR